MLPILKIGKLSVYPENGTKTEKFDTKSQKTVSSWNVFENILHLTDSIPWKLTKNNFQTLREFILC